jgi:hypothetical protein
MEGLFLASDRPQEVQGSGTEVPLTRPSLADSGHKSLSKSQSTPLHLLQPSSLASVVMARALQAATTGLSLGAQMTTTGRSGAGDTQQTTSESGRLNRKGRRRILDTHRERETQASTSPQLRAVPYGTQLRVSSWSSTCTPIARRGSQGHHSMIARPSSPLSC